MTTSVAPAVRCGDHPAVRAWRQVVPGREPVAGVEEIQRKRRSQVYRIRWSGGSVIAKRCRRHMAAVEQAAYQLALPRARPRVRVPDYLGSLQDETSSPADPFTWVFVEDLGARRYRPRDPVQRAQLARWLGRLQAELLPATGSGGGLPVRGAAYYRRYLDQAVEGLPGLTGARALPPQLLRSLATIRSALQAMQDRWHTVVMRFESTPMTLVHGDCLPKNIHVAACTGGNAEVIPIDWGNAGWGLPASDLGHTTLLLGDPVIGPACYGDFARALRPAWPACGMAAVRELATLGRLLWSIKVIAMSLSGFRHDRIDKVEQQVTPYATVLLRSLREWNRST